MISQDAIGKRRVAFAGLSNFRDLGGYPVIGGGQTVWTQVYRADSLHKLTTQDLDIFSQLDIVTIYDLRHSEELELEPGPLPYVNLEMPSGRIHPTAAELRTCAEAEQWLFEDYCRMLANGGSVFGRIFTDLADPSARPVVFHCAGGKDRTGMTAALLLSALGVDRNTILDDYELTTACHGLENNRRVADSFVTAGIARPVAKGILSTPRWVMEKALRVLDSHYGGIEDFLLGPCGLTPSHVTKLRARLIE